MTGPTRLVKLLLLQSLHQAQCVGPDLGLKILYICLTYFYLISSLGCPPETETTIQPLNPRSLGTSLVGVALVAHL